MEQNPGHKTTMPGIIYHVLNEEPLQSKEGSEAQLQTIIGDESFLRQAFDPTQEIPPQMSTPQIP